MPGKPTGIRPMVPGDPPADAVPVAEARRIIRGNRAKSPDEWPADNNCSRWATTNVWSWANPSRQNGRLVRVADLRAVHKESQENIAEGRTGGASRLSSAWLSDKAFAKVSGLAIATVRSEKTKGRWHIDPDIPLPIMTYGHALQICDDREAKESAKVASAPSPTPPSRPGRVRPDNARTAVADELAQIRLERERLGLKREQERVYDGDRLDAIAGHLVTLLLALTNEEAQVWPGEALRVIEQAGGSVPTKAVEGLQHLGAARAARLKAALVKVLRTAADAEDAKDRIIKQDGRPRAL